ncbi:helix-turn-helix domain-containing protein [Paenibacillus alkaliterrae]
MKDVLAYIDQNLDDRLDLDSLAKKASVSPAHFSRVFKQLIGMNITDYIAEKRIVAVKELLLNSKDKINAIAEKCGFESMPHFYRTFKKQTRMTPASISKTIIPRLIILLGWTVMKRISRIHAASDRLIPVAQRTRQSFQRTYNSS